MHVAGAHFLAVDAIARPGAAIDAASDLEHRLVGKRLRRQAIGIVDGQGDFGPVARSALVRAGEDDVVHAGAAHRLGGGRAHDPAQGFEQVRLAAAVRPDNAGQTRVDTEFRRIDKGLEAREFDLLKLQGETPRHSVCARLTPFSGPDSTAVRPDFRMKMRAPERINDSLNDDKSVIRPA